VIKRVPDHVHQWIGKFLDDIAIEFNLFALSLELNLLTEFST
jgi:hypothetical protein